MLFEPVTKTCPNPFNPHTLTYEASPGLKASQRRTSEVTEIKQLKRAADTPQLDLGAHTLNPLHHTAALTPGGVGHDATKPTLPALGLCTHCALSLECSSLSSCPLQDH